MPMEMELQTFEDDHTRGWSDFELKAALVFFVRDAMLDGAQYGSHTGKVAFCAMCKMLGMNPFAMQEHLKKTEIDNKVH